jgi:hypothetical protein
VFQELIKQTEKGHPDRGALDRALEEMKDLSLYVNEVKRDNEALQLIEEIQNSITDLQMVRVAVELLVDYCICLLIVLLP